MLMAPKEHTSKQEYGSPPHPKTGRTHDVEVKPFSCPRPCRSDGNKVRKRWPQLLHGSAPNDV
jgi:hypothetical protein